MVPGDTETIDSDWVDFAAGIPCLLCLALQWRPHFVSRCTRPGCHQQHDDNRQNKDWFCEEVLIKADGKISGSLGAVQMKACFTGVRAKLTKVCKDGGL
jgi:hypothetical protein